MRFGSVRSKLLFFLVLIIALLATSNAISYVADRRQKELNASLLGQQTLVSTIFEHLELTRNLMQKYIQTGSIDTYREFVFFYPKLQEMVIEFEDFPRSGEPSRLATDFRYQIQSFLEAANAAVSFRQTNEFGIANTYYLEALNLEKLITNTFLSVFEVIISDMATLQQHVEEGRRRNLQLNLVTMVIILVVCVLIIAELLRSISKPIDRLTAAAQRIAGGDISIESVPVPRNAELNIMTRAFNQMLDTIRTQIEELSAKQILEKQLHEEELRLERLHAVIKETELRALQSRINPHFLFNTLNMISKMAYLEEADKTSSLIEALASMMRYTLESFQKTVTLAEEMRSLDDYLYIQRLRYEDRIHFSVSCQDGLGEFSIPCLVIQPLVENAIIHGMRETLEGGRISVAVSSEHDRLVVSVKDNGCGIAHERQAEILDTFERGKDDDESGGIGLVNVYQRIKLFCTGRSVFHISSIPGQGTEIRFMIPPCGKKGCDEDAVADCRG